MEQQLSEFRSRASESENRSSEAMNKLRGSFQMVENAITERDEVISNSTCFKRYSSLYVSAIFYCSISVNLLLSISISYEGD